MSTNCKETKSCPIPTRVMHLKDWSQLPDCYSQTPGGPSSPPRLEEPASSMTGSSCSIVGTRLLLAPPCCLPQIPGVTVPSLHPLSKLQDLKEELEEDDKDLPADDNQFEMDI